MELPKQAKVLVVDDFEAMRKVTINQLRMMDINNVVTAANGAEALRILQNQSIDMILSDWNMPVMTGLELLQKVRGDEQLRHLPFVMITADAARAQVEEAIAYGVSDLLVKPYTAARLVERVTKAAQWKPRGMRSFSSLQAAKAEVAKPAAPKQNTRSNILVVDDTPDNLHLLAHLFQDEYQVRVAHNGAKALEICQSDNPPDLLLLDIMMPDMDGFEVAKRMREHPNAENIPIIFVTAMSGDDARLRGLELGAVDFVTKPIQPEVLKPRVKNFLRYVQLHKQLQADYDLMLEANRLREDVEQITRHDLKGPLAGIIGLVQMMIKEDGTNTDRAKQLRMVEDAALQALDMVNLSSELYKIETGRYTLHAQPVEIADVLRRAADSARAAFGEKRLTIVEDLRLGTLPAPDGNLPRAMGDAMLCYSIFQNLIKNACEAAPALSHVSITLVDDNPLQIIIKNIGAVPREIRKNFFDKFVTQGKNGGTGLGTYSAKLLTEAQKGKIELAVSDGENTTSVVVTLPAVPAV